MTKSDGQSGAIEHRREANLPNDTISHPTRCSETAAAAALTEARAIVDEMLARDQRNGFLTDWWRVKLDALDAALAVGDEGIREVSAPELANEIWECLFNETKDAVPDGVTDELLNAVGARLLAAYTISRRPQ